MAQQVNDGDVKTSNNRAKPARKHYSRPVINNYGSVIKLTQIAPISLPQDTGR